jgi:hypothetical protein
MGINLKKETKDSHNILLVKYLGRLRRTWEDKWSLVN